MCRNSRSCARKKGCGDCGVWIIRILHSSRTQCACLCVYVQTTWGLRDRGWEIKENTMQECFYTLLVKAKGQSIGYSEVAGWASYFVRWLLPGSLKKNCRCGRKKIDVYEKGEDMVGKSTSSTIAIHPLANSWRKRDRKPRQEKARGPRGKPRILTLSDCSKATTPLRFYRLPLDVLATPFARESFSRLYRPRVRVREVPPYERNVGGTRGKIPWGTVPLTISGRDSEARER